MSTGWMTPAEFLARLEGRVGRTTVYEALRTGELPSVKVGRKYLIPEDALEVMMNRMAAAEKSTAQAIA